MKGFQSSEVDTYIVRPKEQESSTDALSECVLCSAPLFVESDLGEMSLIKCGSCGFQDLVPSESIGTDAKNDVA